MCITIHVKEYERKKKKHKRNAKERFEDTTKGNQKPKNGRQYIDLKITTQKLKIK